MNKQFFKRSIILKNMIKELNLDIKDICLYFKINIRTAGRWLSGNDSIPETIMNCLSSWIKLNNMGLQWRPDHDKREIIKLFGNNIDNLIKEDIEKLLKLLNIELIICSMIIWMKLLN